MCASAGMSAVHDAKQSIGLAKAKRTVQTCPNGVSPWDALSHRRTASVTCEGPARHSEMNGGMKASSTQSYPLAGLEAMLSLTLRINSCNLAPGTAGCLMQRLTSST